MFMPAGSLGMGFGTAPLADAPWPQRPTITYCKHGTNLTSLAWWPLVPGQPGVSRPRLLPR